MNEKIIQRESLVAIADAIREVTGENKLYTLDDMYKKLNSEFINKLTDETAPLTYIPEGITKIGNCAFAGHHNIAFTSLPAGLTHIGDYAFYNTYIKSMSLPEGLTHIGNYAFYQAYYLESISLPESLVSLNEDAFALCKHLASVTFKGTPSYINRYAFALNNPITINVPWAEGEVSGAPWGATNATINYNYVEQGVT